MSGRQRAARAWSWARARVDAEDVIFLAALAGMCYGFWRIDPPLGWIVGGGTILAIKLLASWRRP